MASPCFQAAPGASDDHERLKLWHRHCSPRAHFSIRPSEDAAHINIWAASSACAQLDLGNFRSGAFVSLARMSQW